MTGPALTHLCIETPYQFYLSKQMIILTTPATMKCASEVDYTDGGSSLNLFNNKSVSFMAEPRPQGSETTPILNLNMAYCEHFVTM